MSCCNQNSAGYACDCNRAVDEKHAPPTIRLTGERPIEVSQPSGHLAVLMRRMFQSSHDDMWIPLDQLPRVVRELAALMSEEQRLKVALDLSYRVTTERIGRRLDAPIDLRPDESGLGISSLPEKSEPLSFLDEDLLCGDE